ncbi:membrane-spanning 4-domains subfamily A member 8 [Austrofundulus limnaeus]|uniref:Membrane-spanning 4-domains subfamily A member 8 n=1 Tax=Austrofundulus limnaeus TaxID=52670 RepID=A0A2I4CJC2_AUSLI|nr:PREDICTED: membrane-spanning 4-domains subfamily A member 8-like [Austrofundulus limnaeus]
MSVIVSRADGVVVLTVISDTNSRWPPLCQIINNLCCTPECCSVSQNLHRALKSSMSVLGALQIMIGLLNIGLGVILHQCHAGPWYLYEINGFPYWLGALFVLFGIMCILSEKFPSPCLVILNVILNMAGGAFAIVAFSYYIYTLTEPDWRSSEWTPESSSDQFTHQFTQNVLSTSLLTSINGVLIVLSILELCVVISAAVLGIKAKMSSEKEPDKGSEDSVCYEPLE